MAKIENRTDTSMPVETVISVNEKDDKEYLKQIRNDSKALLDEIKRQLFEKAYEFPVSILTDNIKFVDANIWSYNENDTKLWSELSSRIYDLRWEIIAIYVRKKMWWKINEDELLKLEKEHNELFWKFLEILNRNKGNEDLILAYMLINWKDDLDNTIIWTEMLKYWRKNIEYTRLLYKGMVLEIAKNWINNWKLKKYTTIKNILIIWLEEVLSNDEIPKDYENNIQLAIKKLKAI